MRGKGSTSKKGFDFYGGRDPRDIPAYSFREVARNLSVAKSTLRAWFVGQPNFKPILHLPADWTEFHALSFFNLIEANVVAELRKMHHVPMGAVRNAMEWLTANVAVPHPLVESDLHITPNQQVYAIHDGRRIDITAGGQWPIDAVVRDLLQRVHKTRRGILAFFPRVAAPSSTPLTPEEYAPIVVNPEVCFGRPTLAGTSIPTDVIADRRMGGDTVRQMAEDYDLSEEQIKAALAFEGVSDARAA